ncbi:MAG: tetratricopeptide repeat protein [Spirochaetaceae bacterium]|jgi:tetratricopeptide (TPR) repeat protein|nr:tetratricopeptide repeat protein [Spirochaetaceae bacterium]
MKNAKKRAPELQKKRRIAAFLTGAFLALGGCSSAPKRPAETFVVRNTAETQLELANQAADQGNYEEALKTLEEVLRLAASVDDPRLRIREGLSRGNFLYALGRTSEAGSVWTAALAEAEAAKELELAASVRIYIARSRLQSGSSPETIRDEVQREVAAMKTEKLSIAFGWIVIGLAERSLGRWKEGEAAIKRALTYHEKNNYLEKAGEDWYLIASIRSLSEEFEAAQEALRNALTFDRRAENGYGVAMDWRAIGDVYKKSGNWTEAQAAYRRSAEIFRALFLDAEAEAVEARM